MSGQWRPSARGEVVPPAAATEVLQHDATAMSATHSPYTGIMDFGTLSKLKERAVYDINTLSYAPVADSGTGVVFPGAVTAKTEVESSLRLRPTTFRGRQQLDVSTPEEDTHVGRQLHPGATGAGNGVPWFKERANGEFRGFPNPDLFYAYMESIPTHNVQKLSHAQLTDALRGTTGAFDHNDYLDRVGALLQNQAGKTCEHASKDVVVSSDGAGVDSDPRIMQNMIEAHENAFHKAKRMQVASATYDPRFYTDAPSSQYVAEQQMHAEALETQFSKVSQMTGVGSSYAQPTRLNVG